MSELNTLSVLLQSVEECLTEAACTDDIDAQRAAINRGLRTAEVLLKGYPDHYQTYHALGVLWYHHPDKTPARASTVKEQLKQAVRRNPASQFSIQYLAYIYFDEGDYRTALSYYEKTDRKFFEEQDQLGRWLKAWESSIACRIHLAPESLSQNEVREFISAYRDAEAKDESPPVQWELWKALEAMSPEYRTRYAEIIDAVRELIIHSGNRFILGRNA